jgi:virginiamycin B lyase
LLVHEGDQATFYLSRGEQAILKFTQVLAVVLGFAASFASVAEAQSYTEYNTPGVLLYDIVAGPDGALWFTENATNKIGRITTDGLLTRFSVPTPDSQPHSIVAGPDGALWFTENAGNKIGRITTAGVVAEFSIPTPNSLPTGIAVGSDGALWFTEQDVGANKIGRITTAGVISEFTVPTSRSKPTGIAAGRDGALWFTERDGAKIGRITTSGVITEFPVPSFVSTPDRIAAGPDGALWFTDFLANKIWRIATTGGVAGAEGFAFSGGPVGIAPGPDGALWQTGFNGREIARTTTAGVRKEFTVLTADRFMRGIATGPDGALWFTTGNNQIGRFVPPAGASPLVAATLPSSRSVKVGNAATAFATILNSGAAATSCTIAPVTSVPASFSYQTTDPATNQLVGTPNTPISIGAGVAQTFLMAFTANAPFTPTNVVLGYSCTNVDAVAPITGVNTLLLTFGANSVPDMIAVGLTPSNDGYSRIPGSSGTGLFVIAATNIGTSAPLTARVAPLDPTMPMTATICQTNPSTGQCLTPPATTITAAINQNQNTTWTAFLQATGPIAQDPARNRVTFQFVDADGVIRGATSTAATTQ